MCYLYSSYYIYIYIHIHTDVIIVLQSNPDLQNFATCVDHGDHQAKTLQE